MKCRRCKVNEDARTRLGGDCHECCIRYQTFHPVLRGSDVKPGMRLVDGEWLYSAAWL